MTVTTYGTITQAGARMNHTPIALQIEIDNMKLAIKIMIRIATHTIATAGRFINA